MFGATTRTMADTISGFTTRRSRAARSEAPPSFTASALLLIAGLGGFITATMIASDLAPLALIALSIGFFTVGTLAFGVRVAHGSAHLRWIGAFNILHNRAVEPALLTDLSGTVQKANLAARALTCGETAERVHDFLPGGEEEIEARVYQIIRETRQKGACRREAFRTGAAIYDAHVARAGDERLIWWFTPRPENQELQRQVAVFDDSPFGVALVRREEIAVNRTLALMVQGDVEHMSDLFAEKPRHSGEVMRLAHPVERGRACRVFFDAESDPDATQVFLLLSTPQAERDSTSAEEFLEFLPVALARLNLDGRLISANAPARKLLGPRAQKGAMIGAMIEGLGRSITERVIEAARGRSSGRAEIARGKIEDRELFLQVSLSRLTIEGEPSLVAVLSDATELKTLEAQFVQSQKMQAVGQLAGGVAHDFNNLLTAINGHCDLLLMRHETGDGDHADLTQIRQNANRAASLVRQMLAFSRKQTLRPKVLTLVETLSELSHLLNRLLGEKTHLKLEHQGDPWRVRVDERQFEQVIMNLVVNARDAMPDGGEVRIRTRNVRLEKELHRDRATVPQGDYALVEVIDCGTGIPPDKIGNIFEPFYTTKKIGEGTGLGLSTAYGIIKQTGGYIFADSEPGAGATF